MAWDEANDGPFYGVDRPIVAVQQCGPDVDALAQEIRRVDGNHDLGAGALAEALMPFLSALPASEVGWPEREEGVDEVILPYAKFISARPELLSLLYDIDMLPEQCVTRVGAVRLAGLCEVWRKGEDGSLPSAPDRRAGE